MLTKYLFLYRVKNPQKAKIPVTYLMDSITKNSGLAYSASFLTYVPVLIPAIYQVMSIAEDRNRMLRLVDAWIERLAFPRESLDAIKQSMHISDAKRSQNPMPSGWPHEVRKKKHYALVHRGNHIKKSREGERLIFFDEIDTLGFIFNHTFFTFNF